MSKKIDLQQDTDNMPETNEGGKIGYLLLYLLGAPVGLLILLWVILGNNIFSTG